MSKASGSACVRWSSRQDDEGDSTKGLSREHTVLVSRSGLVTVTGGKWTTYRAMAEDVLAQCADKSLIEQRAAGSPLI